MFAIDDLIREADVAAAPQWDGAPLRYHETYYSPAELDAAFDRWILENGSFGCIPYSHMWHRDSHRRGVEFEPKPNARGHQCALFTAEARCSGRYASNRSHSHATGELPGGMMTQIICEPCNWNHISRSESEAVEAWHDHAITGWRALPVVPLKLVQDRDAKNGKQRFVDWINEHYPLDAQITGHPIITERTDFGTRHVPGRSPWGGYDLSYTALQ
ncbi:DUF6349 family protein [Leucobacter sp. gxy201]|uniref:DUF6349 family protein n=1 Tax=Leucobacter sp. gxy201 TaxID=2957200 RepID=UPI003DA1923D